MALAALADQGTGTPRVLANQLLEAIDAGDEPEARQLTARLYDACLVAGMDPGSVEPSTA